MAPLPGWMNQMARCRGVASNGAAAGEGATSTVKQPLRVTCDLHHKFGKRQVQQSQWGSKYALNEDMSMKAKLASMARRIEEFELRNVHTEAQPQAMPTSFEYINHPNLTTNLNLNLNHQ
ncbi:hypothetical protein CK203_056913 [Vitis vinifera]|uniref:Uncharacterized protein n=1 Tax=Vitis vinifera TaxID=29760 RepID=A0A438FUL1_VITVI|nr:hypothetical protein CK203_056913 [Vitis vinifera]